MKKILFLSLLLFLITTRAVSQFVAGCNPLKLQLATLAQPRPIDNSCSNVGQGGSDSQAQNVAKNNFCAGGSPVEVNVSTLRSLEARTEAALTQAGIPFGSPTSIPHDRNRLRQGFTVNGTLYKEGMSVFIRAFVLDAHYSNLGKGESVNCKVGKQINNDIHITLGSTLDSSECSGITAEISPHFRPDSWADFNDYEFTHPVMIMGQLFYDASHKPCTPGHEVTPRRISSWEIHPVYAIYVCKNASPQSCPGTISANGTPDPARWTPFHLWVNQPDDEDIGRGFDFLKIPSGHENPLLTELFL
jgi:hypothetical protein